MIIDGISADGITNDSREVKGNYIFAAIRGTKVNGADFIPSAISNGAKTIIIESDNEGVEETTGIKYIRTKNVRLKQAYFASKIYPSQPKDIILVTGTNGKTSTVEFCRQISGHLGIKSASIGTLGVITDQYHPTECLTSPDSITMHKILDSLSEEEVEQVSIEASSHALDQYRLDYVRAKVGIWTNVTQDHLDYHGTLENYFKAKSRILQIISGPIVYNSDDELIRNFIKESNIKNSLSFGKSGSDFCILSSKHFEDKQVVSCVFASKKYEFVLRAAGEFQIYNVAGACLAEYAIGYKPDEIIETTEKLSSAPGRLEKVCEYNGGSVFVDFAHTPDGLQKSLTSLRDIPNNGIITIFGCGGDRDKSKRPIMGEIANKLSDTVIITSDNPRTEDPPRIIDEIIIGCPSAQTEPDRERAIEYGLSILGKGQILLIAGKGHENFQIIGSKKIPFNDKDVALKIAKRLSEDSE